MPWLKPLLLVVLSLGCHGPGDTASPTSATRAANASMIPGTSSVLPPPSSASAPSLRDQLIALPATSTRLRFALAPTERGECYERSVTGVLRVLDTESHTVLQSLHVSDVALGSSRDAFEPVVLTADFNFDGREDFAIKRGCSGPYGRPTYEVYLQSTKGGFARSDALSELAEASLGALVVDADHHTLRTASKSGCCIHWFEWNEIRDDRPRLLRRETIEGSGRRTEPCRVVTEIVAPSGAVRKTARDCSPSELE